MEMSANPPERMHHCWERAAEAGKLEARPHARRRCVVIRATIASLLALFVMTSSAFAQSCTGNPVAVQILGSGGPGLNKDRASTGYLLWVNGQARILVDMGGGSLLRFAQSQAKFSDLAMILVSHLHPDHTSDFP